MTETKTIDEHRQAVGAVRDEAEKRLDQFADEHRAVSVEALSGDEEAKKKLKALEAKAQETTKQKALAEAALVELDRREEEQRKQAEEERLAELRTRHDELARSRRKKLEEVEKVLTALDKKATALLEHDREQQGVLTELGRGMSLAPYDFVLRDRILARLGHLLVNVPGVATGRREPLTEDDRFTQTIAEEEAAKEEGLRRVAERRAEEERLRREVERAEALRNRRYELEAHFGYQSAVPDVRAELEDEIEAILAQEFPPVETEAKA